MNILTASLQLYCKTHRITVRQLEKDTNVSRPTVNRYLQGRTIDSDNFAKLLTWALQTDAPEKTEKNPKKSPTQTSTDD